MSRAGFTRILLALVLWTFTGSLAHAQAPAGAGGTGATPTPAAASKLPPGHPAVGTAAQADEPKLPPGHPAVDSDDSDDNREPRPAAQAHENPHAGLDPNQVRDTVETDNALPRGSVQAVIVDPSGAPKPGVEVMLVKAFQSIAMGDSKDSYKAKTNAQGQVVFKDLSVGRSYNYEVVVTQGAAEYSSAPFQLNRDAGQRVLLHVYPVTRDINQARIAMRGLIYVQPRDDVFQCEVWFQVYNVGAIAWVPSNVTLQLPEGAKAFTAHEGTGNTRFENPEGRTAMLKGTYAPGQQNDVRFSFHVPNEQTSTASFDFPLPPHVAEFRVIVESAPGMGLSARDFPPAQQSKGARGERILVTQKRGMGMSTVHFQLSGLPTRGSAPWIAVLLALGIAAGGMSTAWSGGDPRRKSQQVRGDRRDAKNKILDELVELERAYKSERVGPETYDQTRRALLNALARLLEPPRAR